MEIVEHRLDSGYTIRIRPVPPYAAAEVTAAPQFDYPPPPKITVQTLAGSETVEAPEGHKAYDEYWAKVNEVERKRQRAQQQLELDYGVIEWSEDGEHWVDEPPDDWELDAALVRRLGDVYDRRLSFIQYVLIQTTDDLRFVKSVFYGQNRPIAKSEVEAVQDGEFPN